MHNSDERDDGTPHINISHTHTVSSQSINCEEATDVPFNRLLCILYDYEYVCRIANVYELCCPLSCLMPLCFSCVGTKYIKIASSITQHRTVIPKTLITNHLFAYGNQ